MSLNNQAQSCDFLNESRTMLARNRRYLIPATIKINIKHHYHNDMPSSSTYTHPNIINDNQQNNKIREDAYKINSVQIVKKVKQYIDEI